MVERVSWLSAIQYEILSFYADHDILISPRDLSENIGYDSNYTGRAMRELRDGDVLNQEGQLYSLSDIGRGFLAGEVDPGKIEDRDPTD